MNRFAALPRTCAALALLLPSVASPVAAAAPPPSQNPLFAHSVWVAEREGALKLLAADGRLLIEITGLRQVRAIAIDDQRSTAWIATDEALLAYGFDGERRISTPLELHPDAPALLAVNTSDGSLWLANAERLLKLSAAGQVLHDLEVRSETLALAIDPGHALLWVAAPDAVTAYDATAGGAVRSLGLERDAEVRALSVDPATGNIWVAQDDGLRELAADGTPLLSVPVHPLSRLAVGSGGVLWGVLEDRIVLLSTAGQILASLRPFGFGADILWLAADPADGSVWTATEHEVAHVSVAGSLPRRIAFDPPAEIRGLAVYADVTPPRLQVVAPPSGSFLATRTPTLQVVWSDIGAGIDASSLACQSPAGTIALSCAPAAGGALCTLETPLPDGPTTLTLTVKDLAGNTSNPAAVSFTIDTVPPVVSLTSPAGGLLTRQPQQVVAGALSEPATVTVDGTAVAVAADLTFLQPITLQEGPNTVLVVATDRAGNQGRASVQVVLDTTPPAAVNPQQVTVTPPAGGSSMVSAGPGSVEAGAVVLLTDTATGTTVSTVAAADGSFAVAIACRIGDPIQIVLRDAAGNTSAPALVTVPGPGGGSGGLPPDPATVATPVDRTVVTDIAAATAFLYTGASPIQAGVQAGAVDPFTVAVLRGTVHDRSGQPLPGVAIKVLGHPELGGTLTRADGAFDLAANGGGVLTLQLDKTGFLTAQRQVRAPWRDFVWLDDLVLVPLDGAATLVDTSRTTMQVVRGTAVQDADGSRQATLLFPAGTTAQLVSPGGAAEALATFTVRATEYTVGPAGPRSMPAPLPPASAYTYAVELSADEATAAGATVRFSQPLPFYVENFLNFPVGGVVPAGYYDRGASGWVASANGQVVRMVSITAGLADLDLTGSGAPADAAALAALGITADERQSLAALYPVGQSLWRVPVSHFTPWDFNWPYEVPPDWATPPDPDANPPADLPDPCNEPGASSIGCESQTLGEDVPIAGTPLNLHYGSDRVPDRQDGRGLSIQLTGTNPPPGLARIDLSVSIAGRLFQQSFAPAPNLTSSFAWDGIDAYGRALQGKHLATVTVAYAIDPVVAGYAPPPGFTPAFGQVPQAAGVALAPLRAELSFSSTFSREIGAMDATAEGFGGWTLDVHHQYDPETRTVWRGDGSRENVDPLGTSALTLLIDPFQLIPQSAWLSPDGSLDLVSADSGNAQIDHLDRSGNLQQVYLNHVHEPYFVYRVARDNFNQLYFLTCDQLTGGQIRSILVPGSDLSQLAFALGLPCGQAKDLVSDGSGGFYLAAGSLLHVGADGSIATLVDGARMPGIESVALGPGGNVFFGSADPPRVYQITPAGALNVVAGTGPGGFSGDGGPALFAELNDPTGISVGADGSVWVTDGGRASGTSGRLRRIDPTGFISSAAGGGNDQGATPFDLAIVGGRAGVDPNGALYVVSNAGAWRIGDPFPGFSPDSFLVAAADGREAYQFSAAGRHLATVDPVTGVVLYSFTYDSSNLLAAVQDRDGRLTRIERDAQGNAVAIVSPDDQRTTLVPGPGGYLQSVADPAAETTSFTYTAGGLLTTLTDPRGFQSTYQYTGLGRLALDADAAGGFKQLAEVVASPGAESVTLTTAAGDTSRYDVLFPAAGGRVRLFTGADGLAVPTQTAADGQQMTTWPDGTVIATAVSPDPRFGLQAAITSSQQVRMPSGLAFSLTGSRSDSMGPSGSPLDIATQTDLFTVNGKTFTRVFDRSRMQWTFQTPVGRLFVETLDAAGRRLGYQDGNLAPVQFGYDAAGRVIAETQGMGAVQRSASFTYGPDGRVQTATDPLQRTFSFTWDAAGRLLSQTLPDGRAVGFTYDTAGNLTSVTPPGRSPHGFTLTPVGLRQSYVPPDLGSGPAPTTYSYDLDRRLTAIHRPDGRSVLLAYQQGRLASLSLDRGTLGFTYDPATFLLSRVSTPGGETLTYTADGFLPARSAWSGPVTGSIESSFNQDLELAALTVNGQGAVTYGYDQDGLLVQAGDLSISRDATNGLATGTALGAVTTTWVQSSFGELASVSASYAGSEIFHNDFTRDAGGRIVQRLETILGTTSTYGYAYDAAGRLTDVTRDAGPYAHYEYDGNSNRITSQLGSATTTASYDGQDRLLSWGDTSYGFNANGDLVSKTQNGAGVAYSFDALGNLASVVDADGVETDYLIDGQNRRIGKIVAGTVVQGFIWQDQIKIAAELDGGGNVVSRFVYGTQAGVPDLMLRGGATYALVTDHLGSPRLVIDAATGEIAQRLDYDPWGQVILDTNPGFQPFGFAGGLYDSGTGLIRFGARDYDPAVGRWTARDPLLFGGGDPNLYGYSLSDPVNLSDITGLDTFVCTLALHGGRNPTGFRTLGLYHEYLCVVNDATMDVTCGGQGPAPDANWWDKLKSAVPGANDSRAFNRKTCPLVKKGDDCFDKCVRAMLSGPRPPYNDFNRNGGINCQDYAESVIEHCKEVAAVGCGML